jgi:hypothetical protein
MYAFDSWYFCSPAAATVGASAASGSSFCSLVARGRGMRQQEGGSFAAFLLVADPVGEP